MDTTKAPKFISDSEADSYFGKAPKFISDDEADSVFGGTSQPDAIDTQIAELSRRGGVDYTTGEKIQKKPVEYQPIPYISKIPYVGNVLNTASKGVMQTIQGVANTGKDLAERNFLDAGVNALRGASGVADTIFSPIIGGFQTATNNPVGRGAGDFLSKYIINPVADKVSNDPLLQKFAVANPRAEQVFSDALNVGGSFIGGKKLPEVARNLDDGFTASKGKIGTFIENQVPKEIDSLENVYYNIDSNTKVGKKRTIQAEAKTEALNRAGTTGKTPQRILAESGVIPELSGTRLNTFEQGVQYIRDFQDVMNTSKEAIKRVGLSSEPLSLDSLRQTALDLVNTSKNIDAGNASALMKEINTAFDNYKSSYGDTIRLDKVDDIKTARFENIFKNKSLVDADVLKKDSDYAIAKAMQKTIEDVATKAGHDNVAQLNRVIGDRIDAGKYLQKIDGTVVKGGRLLKYVTTAIGAGAGETLIGKIIGGLTGNAIGQLIISTQIANPIKRMILNRLKATNPESYLKTVEWLRKQDIDAETRKLLPPPSGIDVNINQGRAIQEIPSGNVDYLGKDTVIQAKSPTNQQMMSATTNVTNILDSLSQNTTDRKLKVGNISKDADTILKSLDTVSREEQGILMNELRDIRPKVYKEVVETKNKNRYDIYQGIKDKPMSKKMESIYEPYIPVEELPVIKMGNKPKKVDTSGLPEIQMNDTKKPFVNKQGGFISTNISKDLQPLYKEAQKYKSAEEFVNSQINKRPDYAMSHRPTFEGAPPVYDLLEGDMLPRDVYEKPDWSISSGRIRERDKSALESWDAIQKIRNKPDAEITVYRSSPKNELNSGDWVSLSKTYAKQEGASEGTKAYAHKVKAKDIFFAGDDINEFGYFPKSQLEQIWKEANAKTSTKQGMTAINPLTVGAGVGAGAVLLNNAMSKKESK